MDTSFFDRLRSRRSVLERTRKRDELPEAVLYVEWLSATHQRRVLDAEGNEHVLDDKVIESNYRQASGKNAKRLIAEHWADQKQAPQEPYRAPVSEPAVAPAAAKPPNKPAAKRPPASTEKAAKKPAKNSPAKAEAGKKKRR